MKNYCFIVYSMLTCILYSCHFVFDFVFICICCFLYSLGEYLHCQLPVLKSDVLISFSISPYQCLLNSFSKVLEFWFPWGGNTYWLERILFLFMSNYLGKHYPCERKYSKSTRWFHWDFVKYHILSFMGCDRGSRKDIFPRELINLDLERNSAPKSSICISKIKLSNTTWCSV